MSHIDPEREQFEAFKDLPRDQPINMLNLIRLKDKAEYEGTAPEGVVTGADAYKAYGKESGPIFARVGGSIVWRGAPQLMLIGPKEETWDLAFVARYPNAGAFMEMVTDPEYRKAVKHRQAAVLDSRLLRCGELENSAAFG
ncbi:DUF1330 domain-containing protein [Kordiimonas lacus]|uniref:Uncharacterized conserved protein, DUF1330 family n=1 Tax=Kordiimonas lacus TaxID=637679 RepID=A0A1G7CB63_9PROT|nr:DUF1330 domain-containing protein [Kordiimonas lacus]SDE36559.1 Uncharacterized conserved protein, DUF1330 family [Kordiimonas lacus]